MSDDTTPTPKSQEAAEPSGPPSWHIPVKELTGRVSKLETKLEERLASIDGNLAALAGMTKDPLFRKHALSILGSVAVILGIVAAALAGRASTAPAPTPAPAITVVMPKEAHS